MSVVIKIKVKNLDQIQSIFKKAPVKMARELNLAVNRVLLKVEGTAKRKAPVNKKGGGGNLRQSIRSRMTGLARGIIEVGADYGVFVHEGTRPHTIRVINKKVLANRREGQIFGKIVNHPGTRAQPFLKDALEAEQGFIDKQFVQAVQNVLK